MMSRPSTAPAPADSPTTGAPIEVLLGALMVASAAMTYGGTFVLRGLLLALPAAVVLPLFVVAATGRRRADGTRPSPALGAVFGGLTVLVVAFGTVVAAGGSFADAASGVATVWADLLTRTLPIDGAPVLLLVPALTTGLAALVTGLLVVHRTGPVAPLLPSLTLMLLARLLGGPVGAPVWAVAIMGIAGTILVARRASRSAARAAAAVAVVAFSTVAMVIGLLVGFRSPLGADRPARTLRDTRTLSLEDLTRANPLTDVRAAAASADGNEVVATVRITGPAPLGNTLTLVSLDAFDGADWRSSAQYQRAGSTLPEAPGTGTNSGSGATGATATTSVVRQELTMRADSPPWLPVAPRANRVEVDDPAIGVAVDPITGAVATTSSTIPAGVTFTIDSTVVRPDAASLPRAALPSDPTLAPLARLPAGAPAGLAAAAGEAMGSARSPFQQASALEAWLHSGGRFTVAPDGAGGISYGLLSRFVADTPNGRRGTEEQFAATFVVLARSRGLPARLTIGYRLPVASIPSTTGPDGSRSYELRRQDLAVWPEVAFAGIGWVPFDPVPAGDGGAAAAPQPDEPVEAAKQQAAELANDPLAGPPPAPQNPLLQQVAPASDGGRPLPAIIGIVLIAAVVFAAALLFGRMMRARRRRARIVARRRSGGAARDRVLGAWHEVLDHIAEHEFDADVAATTVPEVTALVEATWGDDARERTRALGRLVSDAAYGPDETTNADADAAWTHADTLLPLLTARS